MPIPNLVTTFLGDVNVPKDTQATRVQNYVRMELMENPAPINVTVETILCAMRYPENASANRDIRVQTVRVDVFKEDSVRIVINCALVRMEAFVTRRLDRVFALLDILERNVKSLVRQIDMDQLAKKSAIARMVVPATV